MRGLSARVKASLAALWALGLLAAAMSSNAGDHRSPQPDAPSLGPPPGYGRAGDAFEEIGSSHVRIEAIDGLAGEGRPAFEPGYSSHPGVSDRVFWSGSGNGATKAEPRKLAATHWRRPHQKPPRGKAPPFPPAALAPQQTLVPGSLVRESTTTCRTGAESAFGGELPMWETRRTTGANAASCY